MTLKVASSLAEIIQGWRLVYRQYVKCALIRANPFSIFTFPQYVSANSAVILGREGKRNVCSISAVLDSERGLPLDACFQEELDALRKENKKLIEIGLLANRSEKASPFYIIELLSSVARFGVFSNVHDYVIGVHPRRAGFYKRLFGFHQVGEPKAYHDLHDAKVMLLHADGLQFETLSMKANRAIYFDQTDLKFENRFRFFRVASIKPFETITNFTRFFKNPRKLFFHTQTTRKKHLVPITLINK